MITYETIKNLVEKESNIKDLSVKDRKSYIRDCRFTYMKLCIKHIKSFDLKSCGITINRCHATIINGIKKFNYDYGTTYFNANEVYDICDKILVKEKIEINKRLNSSEIELFDSNIKFWTDLKEKYINN